jgi:hypothetical protein
MLGTWSRPACAGSATLALVVAAGVLTSGQAHKPWIGVLDEHPTIEYAKRPTSDRVAKLNDAIARNQRTLTRDSQTGYVRSLLDALGLSVDSQLLVFSKTGVQRAYTGPHNPRALFFDESVVVGYVPGAPAIEIAAEDPQQGVVFYTIDQSAATPPVPVRRTSCLSCHVSASTLNVPGLIVRSNTIGDDGNVMPQLPSAEVSHQTPHPDRWGGWFVTIDTSSTPYAQRAHEGNITFSAKGNTSNQVFIDWQDSNPESRGYLSPLSDIVGLLVFDHQTHAINLLTRLNWESRVAAYDGRPAESTDDVRALVNELADYLLFVNEAPPLVPLVPIAGFARQLEGKFPKDHLGRSLGQLNLDTRLLKYPCSYMVYSTAFDGLMPPVKAAVYRRMVEILTARDRQSRYARSTAADRQAVLEILRETKADFPAAE